MLKQHLHLIFFKINDIIIHTIYKSITILPQLTHELLQPTISLVWKYINLHIVFNFNLQKNQPPCSSSLSQNTIIPQTNKTSEHLNPNQVDKQSSYQMFDDKQLLRGQNQVELFKKQQQLINQYMHLNIQLLSKKLQNLEQSEKQPKAQDAQNIQHDHMSMKKKIKKINKCGHHDKEHYAKGMCANCYHKYGRNKKPWNCHHDKLYANGMCQNCYINTYNRKRREQKSDEKQEIELEDAMFLKIQE